MSPHAQVIGEIRLNIEGNWPRADFMLLCVQNGVDFTEDAYLQWRTVGERLTGRPCFETTMKRATAALESLGQSMAGLSKHFNHIIEGQQWHEEDSAKRRRDSSSTRSVAQ